MSGCSTQENIETNTLSSANDSTSEYCTLKEAQATALEATQEWADDAQAVLIMSTDNHDEEEQTNGVDGKRRCWNFMFHSDDKAKEYSIYVIGGQPMYGREADTPYYETIAMEDIPMDSDDLYQLALEENLDGGKDWAWGYHYTLQFRYLNGNDEEPQLTFSVRGINEQEREAFLITDAYTGELLSTIEKTGYDDNGRAVWEEEGGTQDIGIESSMATDDKEDWDLTKGELEEQFQIYENAVKYKMDPQEFADAIIEGLKTDRFSPFSNCRTGLEDEEWREKMADYYGEEWEQQ